MAALNGRANRPTPGPWLVRGEAGEGASAEFEMLGVEPAPDDRFGGWPYLIRQVQPSTPRRFPPACRTGIPRLVDATLLAAAPDLAELMLQSC